MTDADTAPTTPPTKRRGRPARDAGVGPSGMIGFRATPAERAAVWAAAERAGLSVGSYIRSCLLDAPETRATRRRPVDAQALITLQNGLSRIGSNMHQLLRRVRFGETPEGAEIAATIAEYREAVATIMALLGRSPAP